MVFAWEKDRKMNLAETITKTRGRLHAIQKWLGFSDAILGRWETLAEQFLTWLMEGAKAKSVSRDDIADNYPVLWSKFLDESKNDDDFMAAMIHDHRNEDVWKKLNEMSLDDSAEPRKERTSKTKPNSDLPSEEHPDDEDI